MGSAPPSETSRRFELTLPATRAGFAQGFDELRRGLDSLPLDPGTRFAAELVFEEVVANVVRHGATPGTEVRISLSAELEGGRLRLTFLDNGLSWDPSDRSDPPPPTDLEHTQIGGRGLLLIRSASSSVVYQRTPEGRNRLIVVVRGMQQAAPR